MFVPRSASIKVNPKVSKTRGGSRPLMDNVQKEAAFFSGLLPLVIKVFKL